MSYVKPSDEKFRPNLSPNGFNVEFAVLTSDIFASLPSKRLVARHYFIIFVSELFAAEILASINSAVKDGNARNTSIANTATTTTSSNSENPFRDLWLSLRT